MQTPENFIRMLLVKKFDQQTSLNIFYVAHSFIFWIQNVDSPLLVAYKQIILYTLNTYCFSIFISPNCSHFTLFLAVRTKLGLLNVKLPCLLAVFNKWRNWSETWHTQNHFCSQTCAAVTCVIKHIWRVTEYWVSHAEKIISGLTIMLSNIIQEQLKLIKIYGLKLSFEEVTLPLIFCQKGFIYKRREQFYQQSCQAGSIF